MRSDVVIEIFGEVSDVNAIRNLAEQAAAEGMIDWDTSFDENEFVGFLIEAANDGRAFVLTRQDTGNFFEGVTSACQAAALSYVVSFGPSGDERYTNGFSWQPGMSEEFKFDTDGADVTITLASVRSAAAMGIDAINELVARTSRFTAVGTITISPGFEEAYWADEEDDNQAKP